MKWQEGICLTLDPDFQFLEIAFPYVARRLLTDPDPALRLRLLQVRADHPLPPCPEPSPQTCTAAPVTRVA
jgi:hypothetical protein